VLLTEVLRSQTRGRSADGSSKLPVRAVAAAASATAGSTTGELPEPKPPGPHSLDPRRRKFGGLLA